MNDQTDSQLLRSYAERRSDAAFAELARRHVDFVYSAALRMVRDPHLAEDVTQGVFVALAQSAATLTERAVLSGWLHRTAQNIAAQTVRTIERRRAREQEAVSMNELLGHESDAAWEHIAPHLDAALGALSEPDRDALLLRYFERKSAHEMAQTLGISDEAAQKRVTRAVERLRECFAERGVTVGANGLAVVLSAYAVQAAPAGLIGTISTAAALGAASLVTTATATQAIVMTTLQKTLIGAAFALAVGVGIYEARQASVLRDTLQKLEQQSPPAAPGAEANRERNDQARQLAELRVENERLNRNNAELLRLRGEVTRLRQEQARLAAPRPAPGLTPQPATEPEQPAEPVQIFVANADASVAAGNTLALGGWTTSPGKRMLVFVEPKVLETGTPGRVGSVMLNGRFIEAPDEVLARVASELKLDVLEKLKVTGKSASAQSLLTAEQADRVLKFLEQSAGVSVLSAPRIQTGDGVQATLSHTEQKTVAGQEHALGPMLDVEPRIAADGSSVNLTVSARFKKVSAGHENGR